MNHPPKQLALLISLIGVGVLPAAAFAHATGVAPEMLDALACDEADRAALPVCSEGVVDKGWTLPALALEPGPSLLIGRSVANDDWAPGDGDLPGSAGPASVPPTTVRVVVPVRHAVATRFPAREAGRRQARPERHAKRGARPPEQHTVGPATVASRLDREASDPERDGLLPVPPAPADAAPPAARVGPPVASIRVLDDLAAVRARRDGDPTPFAHLDTLTPPASASERVLATLQDIVAPQLTPAPAIEDGPAKRLRKLAARAEKTAAQAATAALAAGVVDLPLPLDTPPAASPFGDQKVAVAATSLDKVRGGFSGDGLNISFGIERAVYINGALVATTTMNITDLGQTAAGRAVATLDAGAVALIQNGTGNRLATGTISSATAGTVIQNTLDGQKIQNITTINASANSLGFYRNLNLGASLRGAVIDSLRH